MLTQRLKSHEQKRILLLGESLRENPRTILLSIPVFITGLIFYSLINDKDGIAGSLGHMGITFKNYHKHFWRKNFLLKIAYFLFNKSALYASGEGKVSTILHCGQTALVLKDFKLARNRLLEALNETKKIKLKNGIDGNIYTHLAMVENEKKNLTQVRIYTDKACKILYKATKENPKSLYIQIWLSNAEIVMGEYWLARCDKDTARIWAEKARIRVNKYHLETRKLDVEKLYSKIGKVITFLIFSFAKAFVKNS